MRIATCLAVASCLGIWPGMSAGQESEPIYEPGNGVSLPVAVKQPPPQYPPGAMRDRSQGAVQIDCVVGTDGVPDQLKVSRSFNPGLDEAAMKAVEQWRFRPGMKDGRPVAVHTSVMVAFSLQPTPKQKVYSPGKSVTTPLAITQVQPPYPKEAMDAGVQGEVRLECVVGTDGTPGDIVVVKRLYPPLDEAAIQALKQWRFAPGKKDKQAVPVRVEIEMTFKMR